MISYFKSYDPIKLPALFILLLAIRLPMYYYGMPLTIPELKWMLIGEKMGEGFVMYRDIWENLGPLSAVVYWLLDLFFGGSVWSYRIIALLLVFQQAVFTTYIYNMNMVREKTMIPGLVYIVFSFLYFDFLTLSPTLMSISFILLMFYYILFLIRYPDDNEGVFFLGFWVGIAFLFYYPAITFLILAILSMLMVTSANPRKLLLLICGFLLPTVIAGVYYFWNDGLTEFYHSYLFAPFDLPRDWNMRISTMILIFAVPVVVTGISIFIVLASANLTNVLSNIFRIMVFYIVLATVAFIVFARNISAFQYYIFLPAIAYFYSFAISQLRKRKLQEFSFLFVSAIVLFITYGSLYDFGIRSDLADNNMLTVERLDFHDEFTGRRIWVTGHNKDFYYKNSLGMPYLNMELANKHLKNLSDYEVVGLVYENFEQHRPEVIVDQQKIMPEIFRRLPLLEEQFTLWQENIYVRK